MNTNDPTEIATALSDGWMDLEDLADALPNVLEARGYDVEDPDEMRRRARADHNEGRARIEAEAHHLRAFCDDVGLDAREFAGMIVVALEVEGDYYYDDNGNVLDGVLDAVHSRRVHEIDMRRSDVAHAAALVHLGRDRPPSKW